jgi:hypothetical protein
MLEALKAHAIARHLDEHYTFPRMCRPSRLPATSTAWGAAALSGELLGPPNYHGYNERLMDLHRTRFAHLKLDDYRAQVEIVRDPAVVEQWKESCRTQRVYRPKDQPEAAPLKREEAVAQFVTAAAAGDGAGRQPFRGARRVRARAAGRPAAQRAGRSVGRARTAFRCR